MEVHPKAWMGKCGFLQVMFVGMTEIDWARMEVHQRQKAGEGERRVGSFYLFSGWFLQILDKYHGWWKQLLDLMIIFTHMNYSVRIMLLVKPNSSLFSYFRFPCLETETDDTVVLKIFLIKSFLNYSISTFYSWGNSLLVLSLLRWFSLLGNFFLSLRRSPTVTASHIISSTVTYICEKKKCKTL